ncbi:MAG TPA: nuclear transport factor 2 family protein [Anaerohalosphaeraceae bacterium]|nr:nuclear transport factor 2 family protein [Anaerohalosphaeraceae bacterium]
MSSVSSWSVRIIVAAILLAVCSCRTAGPVLSESRVKAIKEQVRQVHDKITDAAARADVETMFSYVAENDDAIFINDGKQLLTRKQAYDVYTQRYKGIQKVEYQFSRQDVTVVSPQTVLWIEQGRAEVTTTDGRTFGTSFNQTIVFVLKEEGWKALYTHVSDDNG